MNVECTKEQQRLLNPTVLDTITGFIIKDSQGDGAKRRLPQRRLNLVDANISSHCCVLNSQERMELIRKSNEVAAIMGEIENNRNQRREANKRKKQDDQAAKAARKKLQQEKQKEKENKARETCEKTMELLGEKGTVHIQKLTVPVMKDLLRFVFCSEDYKRTDLRKPALIALVTSKYEFEREYCATTGKQY